MKTLIVMMLSAFVSLGNAQVGGFGRGDGLCGGERLKEMLNLSDEAAAKIEKLRVDHMKDRIALRAKLDAARVDFRALMRSGDPDEKRAMSMQKEMAGMREALQTAALAHRFAVARLLTPEQRKIWNERHSGAPGRDGCREFRGERGRRLEGRPFMKHRRGMGNRGMMERDDD